MLHEKTHLIMGQKWDALIDFNAATCDAALLLNEQTCSVIYFQLYSMFLCCTCKGTVSVTLSTTA